MLFFFVFLDKFFNVGFILLFSDDPKFQFDKGRKGALTDLFQLQCDFSDFDSGFISFQPDTSILGLKVEMPEKSDLYAMITGQKPIEDFQRSRLNLEGFNKIPMLSRVEVCYSH